MARRKRKAPLSARVVTGLPVIRRQDELLEPVYEADPDGRPVVHHRTVDTLGIMLRAGTITQEMHDAARDFQAQFTIARFDVIRCMPLVRLPGGRGRAISPKRRLTPAAVSARRWMRSAGSAVRPDRASGTSSACSARSASGRCGRAGAGGRFGSSRRRGSWWRRWGCWRGATGMGKADGLLGRGPDRIDLSERGDRGA